jgi:hypothetical protein
MNNSDNNNLIKDGLYKEQYAINSNTNLIQHVNRNIQRDDIRNKTRKICLLFKTDCIRIEITKKGMKIEKKNLHLEDNEPKEKHKSKIKNTNDININDNNSIPNIKIDSKRNTSHNNNNNHLKENNENINDNNTPPITEDIQTTPKMTKRKRSRNKNDSTNRKTPSNTSTTKQHPNKRRLNLCNNRITKKKLIL